MAATKSIAEDGRSGIEEEEVVTLLGEVVGGCDISFDDQDGVELMPFCVVQVGRQQIHQTKKAAGGRNPIWTVSSGSFFVLPVTPRDLIHQTLAVSVWYKQRDSLQLTVLDTCCLGKASIRLSDIVLAHCNEKRVGLDLKDPRGFRTDPRGSITLRFRLATPSDE